MDDNLRVVIAAAGAGTRMGKKINKQYMLLKSRPLLTYSLDVFEKSPLVEEMVIVAHPQEVEYCEREIVKKYGYKKVNKVVAGGKERQDSIWAGLKQLGQDTAFVAVHDGARPFISSMLIEELLQKAQEWGAAIPGVAVKDTLKHVDRDGFVRQTLDRESIIVVQTPQIFKYAELCEAYTNAYEEGLIVTDDAGLFEKYIGRVKVVTGDYFNIKITTPEDMLIAKSLVRD
ncbi:MAG: 2-C-methyl-D-erythritol 4-phosphate cytidylyltransferase [Syntrophomonas sp.]